MGIPSQHIIPQTPSDRFLEGSPGPVSKALLCECMPKAQIRWYPFQRRSGSRRSSSLRLPCRSPPYSLHPFTTGAPGVPSAACAGCGAGAGLARTYTYSSCPVPVPLITNGRSPWYLSWATGGWDVLHHPSGNICFAVPHERERWPNPLVSWVARHPASQIALNTLKVGCWGFY